MKLVTLSCILALWTAVFAQGAEEARGRELFVLCSACHGADGRGQQIGELKFPAIAGLEAWYVEKQLKHFQEGIRGAHPEDTKGLMMRPMSRALTTEADVKAVSAFVATLSLKPTKKEVEGDLTKGEFYYQSVCLACHGANFEGNTDPAIQAPSQKPLDDWYMLEQLVKFKEGIRGTHPQDMGGAQMVPIMQVLPGLAEAQGSDPEQALKDVVAFIYSKRE